MSRHDGVSCDACIKGNFKGRRYKCLICFDYDLCSSCYENGSTTNQHTTNHPMQCILTRHDFDIFHGGESLTPDQPQSLTCPYCGKMGFTEITLQEHVTAIHSDAAFEVVCPICASVPGGDPNHLPDDFAAHLTLDHRSGAPRELDVGESGSRHGVRRIPHQGRALSRGVARQNMRSVGSGFFSSSSRESMDPIAELLSQLSGVRRATASDLLSADSQATRQQQLERERLPTRRSNAASGGLGVSSSAAVVGSLASNGNTVTTTNASNVQSGNVVTMHSHNSNIRGSTAVVASSNNSHHHTPSAVSVQQSSTRVVHSPFLLTRLGSMENEKSDNNAEIMQERSSFVQEMLLSSLSEISLFETSPPEGTDDETYPPTSDASTQTPNLPSSPSSNPLTPQQAKNPPQKAVKPAMTKPPPTVVSRSSPNLGSGGGGRTVTGTGTVSVPPAPPVRPAAGGPVSPGAGRRKPRAPVESRTSSGQP